MTAGKHGRGGDTSILATSEPVFGGWEPIFVATLIIGFHVTRTTRIEPRTPKGAANATHPFRRFLATPQSDSRVGGPYVDRPGIRATKSDGVRCLRRLKHGCGVIVA